MAIETIETEEDEPMISGGVTHNFERDLEPFNPADKGEWDEDRFGFQ